MIKSTISSYIPVFILLVIIFSLPGYRDNIELLSVGKKFEYMKSISTPGVKGSFQMPFFSPQPPPTHHVFADSRSGIICDDSIRVADQLFNHYPNEYTHMSSVTDWKYVVFDFSGQSEFWITYVADSTVNSKIYRRYEYFPKLPWSPSILIREDTIQQKVYQYHENLGDMLLYDFSLQLGDAFTLPTTNLLYTVSQIDSVIGTNGILKRWTFSHPFRAQFSYTEAIGGRLLEYYIPETYSDPVWGFRCAFKGCDSMLPNQECEFPEPRILRDTIQKSICAGDNFMGFDSAGVYSITRSSELYCAEITLLNLTVLPSVEAAIDTILCEGQSYFGIDVPGDYVFQGTSVHGCDSTTFIHLEIDKRNEWRASFGICEGTELTVRNWIIDKAGIYGDTVYNSRGCIDTIFVIEVDVYETDSTFVDTTICDGENYLGFSSSGMYNIDTVDIETGCRAIIMLDLDVLPANSPECISSTGSIHKPALTLYPNPVRGEMTLQCEEPMHQISIYSSGGRFIEMYNFDIPLLEISYDLSRLTAGLYFLKVKTNQGTGWIKCVLIP